MYCQGIYEGSKIKIRMVFQPLYIVGGVIG